MAFDNYAPPNHQTTDITHSLPGVASDQEPAVFDKRIKETNPKYKRFVQLGGATLLQGNCLDVLPSLRAGSVDLVVTDLPYGTTACPWDSIIPLEAMWRELRRVGTKNCVFVFTAQQPFTWALCASNPREFKHELIWEKPNGTNPFQAKFMPMKKHENVLVFGAGKVTYNPQMQEGKPYKWNSRRSKGQAGGIAQIAQTPIDNQGTRYPGSVLQFKQERGLHPTQKPVGLMEWIIRTYSNPGSRVLDITMGSGTTGIAALKSDRLFTGIELDDQYFNITVNRLRAHMGLHGSEAVNVKKNIEIILAGATRKKAAKRGSKVLEAR